MTSINPSNPSKTYQKHHVWTDVAGWGGFHGNPIHVCAHRNRLTGTAVLSVHIRPRPIYCEKTITGVTSHHERISRRRLVFRGGRLAGRPVPVAAHGCGALIVARKPATDVVTGAAKQTGRPSKFAQHIADEVVRRVSEGEPLAPVVRDLGVGLTTWYDWVKARPDLSEAIARAREAGEEVILADTLGIADAPPPLTSMGATDGGAVQHAKLRIETRLKLLAKWNPRKWGEKVQVGGADDLPAVQTNATVTLDPSEAYKRMLGGAK